MSYNLESEVSKSFGRLLETGEDYNVIIHIGKEPNFKEFRAHSIIIRCRSEYFDKILSAENIEKKGEVCIIKEPNISPNAFDIIFKYLYTGHINISNVSGSELFDIVIASNELNLKHLTQLTQDYMVKAHYHFLQNDSLGILQTIYQHQLLVDLQEFCLETICSNPKILFNSDKFINLPAPLLEIILKRDDLNLVEVEIWENLIKWGLAQEQKLNQDIDISKWDQEDIDTFKKILHKFFPLIRFREMSSEEYLNKVEPYEEILPKELRDDILNFHMIPDYKPTLNIYPPRYSKCGNINSIIINPKHATLFASWIDRKEESKKYIKAIPYDFELIYRASRDGSTVAAFHEKCDNKGATIVVAKIKGSGQLIGGYNPLEWDSSNSHKHTIDSFIFSFKDTENTNVGYSIGDQESLGCYPYRGPVFGSDLYHKGDKTWFRKQNSYPKVNIPTGNFNVDDYEVFRVEKKTMKNTMKI